MPISGGWRVNGTRKLRARIATEFVRTRWRSMIINRSISKRTWLDVQLGRLDIFG
jgi:hypothetical protein